MANVLSNNERALIDAYWRAANYLSVGQIYLYDNPLLKQTADQGAHQAAAARALGDHSGPELHLRAFESPDQEARSRHDLRHRPGARRARRWWPTPIWKVPTARSTRTSRRDEEGMKRLFKQFSFPGGIPSHVAPETPGSIHEGGELGYALSHAYGAAFDNPGSDRRLRRRRRRGRNRPAGDQLAFEQVPEPGDATAPCCRSCISTATRSPIRPCWPASATRSSTTCSAATATRRISSKATSPTSMHELMAATLDRVCDEITPDQSGRAAEWHSRTAPLADDRAAHAQGMDMSEGNRRPANRGLLARRIRCRWATCTRIPSTCGFLKNG